MRKDVTCAPLFERCTRLAHASSQIHIYYLGYLVGLAEKVWLGACRAAVVRPQHYTADLAGDVLKLAKNVAEVYGLCTVSITLSAARGMEIWLCRDEQAVDDAMEIASMEPDTPEWHQARGRLCGVPEAELDIKFHERRRTL